MRLGISSFSITLAGKKGERGQEEETFGNGYILIPGRDILLRRVHNASPKER
jgi:hypothetical protein